MKEQEIRLETGGRSRRSSERQNGKRRITGGRQGVTSKRSYMRQGEEAKDQVTDKGKEQEIR